MSWRAGKEERGAGLAAVLWAATLLVSCESLWALSLRATHPGLYYAFCIVLTLGACLVLGFFSELLRLKACWALALWTAAGAWAMDGWPAVAAVVPALVCMGVWGGRGVRPQRTATLVVASTAGLVYASLNAPLLQTKAPLSSLPDVGSGALALGVLFTLVAALVCGLARLLGRWLSDVRLAVVLGLIALVGMAQPFLDRPSGTRRLPRPADLVAQPENRGAQPNVFLLVLDTVRADHLSVYGYDRPTTPELEQWIARRGNAVVYQHCYANGTWTVPSHASLFTGQPPGEHGAHFDREGQIRFRFALNQESRTLAECTEAAGYANLACFANNWLRVVGGMSRGFHRYFRAHHSEPLPFVGEALRKRFMPGIYSEVEKGGSRGREVTDTLMSMVRPWSKGEKPMFLFANYGDTHGPYVPPTGYRGRFAPVRITEEPAHLSIHDSAERLAIQEARYDEELAYLDAELGRLLTLLAAEGILDDSWVFITSDHGEAFAEHGVTEHGTTVHDEVVRVPLIVFPPRGHVLEATDQPVSLVDVAETIAGIAGVPLSGTGHDLRDSVEGRTATIEFYGDAWKARAHGELAARHARVVARGRYKLIELGGDRLELYDVVEDPQEYRDLAAIHPEVVAELRVDLPEMAPPTAASGSTSATDLANLRAMGYIE